MEEIYAPLPAGIVVGVNAMAGVALALEIFITTGAVALADPSTVDAPIQIVLASVGSTLTAVSPRSPISATVLTEPEGVPFNPVIQKYFPISSPAYKTLVLSSKSVGLMLSLIHISEPTRLLSISYAVFCLKK